MKTSASAMIHLPLFRFPEVSRSFSQTKKQQRDNGIEVTVNRRTEGSELLGEQSRSFFMRNSRLIQDTQKTTNCPGFTSRVCAQPEGSR